MNNGYRLKTARPLPNSDTPARVTQPRPLPLTALVDYCNVWRSDAVEQDRPADICANTPDVDGNETTFVNPEDPQETAVVEIDLEDPIIGLILLLRYREVFGTERKHWTILAVKILLLDTGEEEVLRRVDHLLELLWDLDVPAEAQ